MTTVFPVGLSSKRYSAEFQEEAQYARQWQRVLAAAYGNGPITCLCRAAVAGQRQLAIKLRQSTNLYSVARYAHTGHEHNPECRYYAEETSRSGRQGYAEGVLQEDDKGGWRLRLERGIDARVREAPSPDEQPPDTVRAPGARRPSMSLLGLLHFLFSEARINVWAPKMEGKRSNSVVWREVVKVAERTTISRGVTLEEILLRPAMRERPEAEINAKIIRAARQHQRRLVVVGQLAKDKGEVTPAKLTLSRPFGSPHLWLPPAVWERAQRRFGSTVRSWHRGEPVVAIALLELRTVRPGDTGPGAASIVDLALMRVTERWIPIESSYERLVEQQLVATRRQFVKPLRYDADEFALFPDFWLTDVGKWLPMEVFGMQTEDYIRRREEKRRWYLAEFGSHWWEWVPQHGTMAQSVPDFPPKAAS